MASPVLVAEYEVASWSVTTTPRTVSPTVATGDWLVIFGITDDGSTTLATPTGGSLTYSLQQSSAVTNNCAVYLWTAPCPSAQSFTLSIAATGGGTFGYTALRFSGAIKVGASTKATGSGAPSMTLNTVSANPAVVVVDGDFNGTSGTRTWLTATAGTLTEQTFSATANYTAFGGYHPNAGAPGAKTLGMSAPAGQSWTMAAVELIGVAPPVLAPVGATGQSYSW